MISGTSFVFAEPGARIKFEARTRGLPQKDLDDIWADVDAQKALCLEGPDGLLVVALIPGELELELSVLLAVSTGAPGAFERQDAAVCAIARDLGASAVSFFPQRRGWSKLLGSDWVKRGDTYVRLLHGEEKRRGPGNAATGCDGAESTAANAGLQSPVAPSPAAHGATSHGAGKE